MSYARPLLLTAALLALAGPALPATPAAPAQTEEADAVFARARSALLQLRVVVGTGGPQASIGSGFVASADGLVVTNYHVVSKIALEPGQYSVEYVRTDGARGPLKLLAVDVAHDLAVLRMAGERLPFLALRDAPLARGERGYSLGNPHDLGTTIVEGTYNGLIEGSLYDQIHFSGAINGGMSGGPAIARDGRVFGINVARDVQGQLIGFLVPAEYAKRLLAEAASRPPPEAFRKEVNAQLLRHQAALAERILQARFPAQGFGHYDVPTSPGPYMRCWGSTRGEEQDRLYESSTQQCRGNMELFVSDEITTGGLAFWHLAVESDRLNWVQFRAMYEERFARAGGGGPAERKSFTPFRCHDDFVRAGGGTVRAVICARSYKQYDGLYDLRVRIATLEPGTRGLQSDLRLSGFTFENGMRLARHYLEAVSWTN